MAMTERAVQRNGAIGPGVAFGPGARRSGRHARHAAAVMVLCGATVGQPMAGEAAVPLRLCADPTNLPFSSDHPDARGLYVEIGETIGHAVHRPVTAVWTLTYFGKRALRTTLLAGQCDLFVGVPDEQDFMGPRIIFSKPLLELGYALVTPRAMTIAGLNDLAGRRVAVQFGSTPQSLLAERDDIQAVTFREAEDAMQALADRKVDAAFVWGPIAGYLNRTSLGDAFNVVPVAGPGMQWTAAVGVARREVALRDEVNRAIDVARPAIEGLKTKYGLPNASPVTLATGDGKAPDDAEPDRAGYAAPEAQPVKAASADVQEGNEIFNGICGHCHGPNAVQGERRIDLRLLRHRYAERMDEVYQQTVTRGRPSKGMPNWSEVLTREQIEQILAYLRTVQTD